MDETALALRVDRSLSPYEPTTYDQARAMARDFVGSKLTKCRSPEQALLIMATGRELGIPATTALRMIYVADFGQGDQVALSADLMVALCLRSPLCEYFRCVESTDVLATYATKRKGDPERSFSFAEADRVKAKLGFSKDGSQSPDSNWAKYRKIMLMHRAAAFLAREVYSDVIGGFYTVDEAADMAAASGPFPVQPLPAAPAGKAHDPQTGEVRDAEFTEVESDETRIVRQLGEATTAAEVQAVAQEAVKIWPRERPAAVKDAHKAAKQRLAAPAKEPPPRERQPGEEG